MAGLAIDGGGAFAQRRDQQTAADLAALAAANDYLMNSNATRRSTRAATVATTNGYHARACAARPSTSSIDTSNGVAGRRRRSAPHHGTRSSAHLGMPTWDVTTSASALAGFPDSAAGRRAVHLPDLAPSTNDGTPKYQTPTDFNETNGDIPTSQTDIAWTNYGTGNLDTPRSRDIITGDLDINKTIELRRVHRPAQQRQPQHAVQRREHLPSGQDLPVAVVDAGGNFMGWAMFHVISATAGSAKHINGYFLSSFTSARLRSRAAPPACPRYLGAYVLKLTD